MPEMRVVAQMKVLTEEQLDYLKLSIKSSVSEILDHPDVKKLDLTEGKLTVTVESEEYEGSSTFRVDTRLIAPEEEK